MNLIESKETYLNELIDINELHKRALSLAIDCVIDNESEGQDLPIVLTSYDDTCDSLIRNMRRYEQSYIYLADSPASFENLPSGLFHIVDIEYKNVTRYKNTRKGDVPQKKYVDEYGADDYLSGLFDLVAFGEKIKVSDATEASNLLFDECNACIIRPIPAPKGAEYSSKITISSPEWEKRRKGKLKNLWSDLKYTYGNFDVEQPNANMKAFMKAMSDSKKSEL